MDSCQNYVELIRKAQLGDRESLNRLAEAARLRLHAYVLRLTLQEDLTQDIVQESILEMFKLFGKLKKTERFWPWLYGIAFNKVRGHYGKQWRHRTVSLSDAGRQLEATKSLEPLAEMVTQELKQVVLKSMRELEPRHRAVLTMRCYDRMAYGEIAKLMGCTELGVRALFYRAKKALAKKLSGYGFSKAALPATLVVFGKLTASSEAAAASISITAGTIKVGAAAVLTAVATSKTGLISLATAGMIAAGSIAAVSGKNNMDARPREPGTCRFSSTSLQTSASRGSEECWYFYPEGAGQSVMMRLREFDASGKQAHCRALQNQYANYWFDSGKNTITMNNYHIWESDLSVKRLPTDGPALSEFLSLVEGKPANVERVSGAKIGTLIICKRDRDEDSRIWRIHRHINTLEEEYFQFNWPDTTRVLDNRDDMHKRGWTYFRVTGELGGKSVSGAGRIPFVYATSKRYYPWLTMKVGQYLKFEDSGTEASIYDGSGKVVARYEGGSFFKGLARPWMGLHTIDIVRRDAAQQRVWFETRLGQDETDVEIVLSLERMKIIYTIDMNMDVMEKITFASTDDQRASSAGELRFSYLQDIDNIGSEFAPPRRTSLTGPHGDGQGMLWLVRLAEEAGRK